MKRFLESIQLEDVDRFDLSFEKENAFYKENGIWHYRIKKETPWNFDLLYEFRHHLEFIDYSYVLHFSYTQLPSCNEVLDLLYTWYKSFYHLALNPLNVTFRDREIYCIFQSALERDKMHGTIQEFQDFLTYLGYPFTLKEVIEEPEQQEETLEDEHLAYIDQVVPELKKREEEARRQKAAFKRGDYTEMKIIDIDTNSGNVSVQGNIFFVDEMKTSREGKKILTFDITDLTYSVAVRVFENKIINEEKILEIKKGKKARIRGSVQIDKFTQQIVILAHFIDFLEPDPLREDDEEEKRIELHLHTKMSAMDAVATITDYCKLAAHFGHPAIGLTDHGNVQAFPEAQKAAKEFNIKVLYGCEMYMVDEKLSYIQNPSDVILNKASYVVFDFETTGLSARYDRIIEFGAVRLEGGVIVDRLDLLVNPGDDFVLSKKIQNLTNITPQMLKGKPYIKEAVEIIRNFIKDSILVSHNADFDIGFMNEAFHQMGYPSVSNPVIDTLSLSRYMFPEARQHNLGALSRNLEVTYEEGKAHRADYDAEVLLDVWLAMLAILTKNNFNMKHCDLNNLEASVELLKHLRPKHVVVYPKNPQGLKDLFLLVSLSNIEYIADLPKIPRSQIEKYRENFIIGSACFNGEVFDTAMTRSKEVLEEKVKFYDYIEIQPLENYSFLLYDGQIESKEKLTQFVKDIASAAEKMGKRVVATGDAHYLNPEDKIYRDVYIMAKGIQGVRHPLNPFRRESQPMYPNPDQHFRTTREMLDAFIPIFGEEKAKEYVITNTHWVSDQIEQLFPIKSELYAPKIENCAEELQKLCYDKCYAWYGYEGKLPDLVAERLDKELTGIIKHNYSVIYYIAHKLIKRANEDGFLVGSRGSVGSSFVATMASITEVNPLPPHYRCPHCKYSEFVTDRPEIHSGFDLEEKNCPHCGTPMIHDGQDIPFATFLGFNADKVPDIDLNFSGDYQAKAHEMTKELLGKDNVFKAGTIETVAEKTAFGYVRGYFERIGKNPDTISRAEIARIAVGCQDVKRTTGQHPGGIVVIPRDYSVYDFTPIQYPADKKDANWKTTHFDFHAIHDNVLKLDLLGHVDPTAMKMLEDITGIDPTTIPMGDKEVLSLFSSDKALHRSSNYLKEETGALGLPEFGTNFVRGMLKETRPKTFADLLIISGLSHGTNVWNGNAQDLVTSGTCTLSDVIGCRDDIMIGLSKMGVEPSTAFKIMEDVRKGKKVKPEYEEIMKKNNVPQWYIDSCNKIQYLFPKAHATAYVMMAVRIAWFKVYQPLAYYACFFSIRCDQYDLKPMLEGREAIIRRLEELKEKRYNTNGAGALSAKEQEQEKTLCIALEMYERGYSFENIDLYRSEATRFVVDKEKGKVIPSFSAIDGLGANAALSIIEARKDGPFLSKEDLVERTKLNSQNMAALEELHVLDDLQDTNQMDLFSFEF